MRAGQYHMILVFAGRKDGRWELFLVRYTERYINYRDESYTHRGYMG